MTDKVHTSFGRTFRSREASIVNRYTGLGAGQGWVVKSSRRLVADSEGDLSSGALNAFDESHSGGSFDVTIDTGEALVRGAYLARDTTTTVTLASSTNNQTVYVGWQDGAADTVIIGKAGAFTSDDPKLAIWEFDTDGSGVTSATDKRPLGEPTVSGVTYTQSSQPSSPSAGETWYDTDSGIYRVYADLGSGPDWHPIPPVTVTEEASTFAESDVTVTHNNTSVSSGSIELIGNFDVIDDFESGDLVVENTDWNDWGGDTGNLSAQQTTVLVDNWSGEFSAADANTSVNSTRTSAYTPTAFRQHMEMDNQTGNASDVSLLKLDDGAGDAGPQVLFFHDGSIDAPSGTSVRTAGTWSANTHYRVTYTNIDFTANTYDLEIRNQDTGTVIVDEVGVAFQSNISDVSSVVVRSITSNSGQTVNHVIDEFIADEPLEIVSGNALVEWDSAAPTDIKSYDLVTFQRTLDGESVTIDVEDGAGNVLFSDIGQNFDISTVDTTKEVKLRANLSTADTSNNPTVDYLARRFTR